MFNAWLSSIMALKNGAGLGGQLIRGASGSILIKVASAFIGLGVTILLARLLGPQDYGIYAFAFSLVTLLTVPVQLGLPTLLVREVVTYHAGSQWGLINGLLRTSDRVVVSFALFVVLVAGLAGYKLSSHIDSLDFTVFLWGLALLPVMALAAVRGGIIRGLGHVITGQLPDFLMRPAVFFVLLMAMLVGGRSVLLSPSMAMALHLVAACFSLSYGVVRLYGLRPIESRKLAHQTENRRWLASAVPFALLAGVQVMNNQTDIVLLGLLTTAENVGIYRVILQGAALVAFALSAINMVIAPRITSLYHSGDMVRLQRMVTWSARVVTLVALPVTLVFVFAGDVILHFLFGDFYVEGADALAVLSVGQFVNAMMGSVGLLLAMTGHERDAVIGVSLAACINLLLNLVLIPEFAIEGAAWATFSSLVFLNVYMARCVRMRLGIKITAFSSIK